MKIHIVQKGDTLWEISKVYGVDFEELKELNTQLSSPDMIMPGMKIRIPSTAKPVKQKTDFIKETKKTAGKEEVKQKTAQKSIEIKPLPIIQADDDQTPKEVKTKMPINYTPKSPAKKEALPKIQTPEAPIKEMIKPPLTGENIAHEIPVHPSQQHPAPGPICHHCHLPCCPPVHYCCCPFMGQLPQIHPEHLTDHMSMGHHPVNHHCGCQQMMPQHHYRIHQQIPGQFPLVSEEQEQSRGGFYGPIEDSFPTQPGYSPISKLNDQATSDQQEYKAFQTIKNPIND